MSEQTGASPEQIEAAHRRAWDEQREQRPYLVEFDQLDPFAHHRHKYREAAAYLVPPGYRIVPAEAVVVTPEIAAVAAEACVSSSRRFHKGAVRSEKAGNDLHSEEMHKIAARYQAAAAALRGEG